MAGKFDKNLLKKAIINNSTNNFVDMLIEKSVENLQTEQRLKAELEAAGEPYLSEFAAEYAEVAARLGVPRLLHSLGVAQTARELAEKFGGDPAKAYLAGLCHDIAKEMPKDEMLGYVKRSALADDEAVLDNRVLWHAPAGAVLLADLAQKYPRFDAEVQAACLWHTLGRPGMSRLEQQVFVADLIEPGRNFPDLAEIRRAAGESLTEGVAACLWGAIHFLQVEGRFVHPLAEAAYAYYKEETEKN